MNVLLTINERQAIPVRALAFVTDWVTAPDRIAHACAASPVTVGSGYQLENRSALSSYIISGESFRRFLPSEWKAIIVELDCLTAEMKADERAENENWAIWRKKATITLPDGVFVWLDEFKRWLSSIQTTENAPHSAPNTDPFIPAEIRDKILNGFKCDQNSIDTVVSDTLRLNTEIRNKDEIPGKMPKRAAPRLAIKAAWEIECASGKRASDKEVMDLLQKWADENLETDVIKKAERRKHSVIWITSKGEEREFTIEACGKALGRWHRHRQENKQTLDPLGGH